MQTPKPGSRTAGAASNGGQVQRRLPLLSCVGVACNPKPYEMAGYGSRIERYNPLEHWVLDPRVYLDTAKEPFMT